MKTNKLLFAAALVSGLSFTSCTVEDNPTAPQPKEPIVSVADFEDANVAFKEGGYWNGDKIGTAVIGDWDEENYYCSYTTGQVTANVTYSYMYYEEYGFGYDWWGGVAISNRASNEFKSLDDQYNNIVGSGANGSANFGVIYGNGSTVDINVEGGAQVTSLSLANSCYTMNSVLVGDGYSPKFQKDGDYIRLVIEATKADGTTASKTVALAEYTTALSYIEGWEVVDLSELGDDVTKLTFNFEASNSGIPLYACIDDIVLTYDE